MLTTQKASQITAEPDPDKRDEMVDLLTEEDAKDLAKFLLDFIGKK